LGSVLHLYDRELHEKANCEGRNYWGVYVAELLDWLGVPRRTVAPHELERADMLAHASALVLGRDAAASLKHTNADLTEWVRRGGLLIGLMPEALEGLFGVEARALMRQGTDPFNINSTFGWVRSPLTRGIGSPLHPPEPLPILSDRMLLQPAAGTLAASPEGPAIVYRRVGRGATLYFAYDLAQTAWAIHQGRPVDRDYDLDEWRLRVTDGAVTGMRLTKALVVDEVLLMLERVLARHGVASLDRLPPQGGRPSDILLFWGGDDECKSDSSQLFASEFMKARGLPYHMNIMPDAAGQFGLSPEHARRILANGHELSIHFNFTTDWPKPDYSAEDLERQWSLFVGRFGVRPEVYVSHCLRWCGWDETPLALERLGMRGENLRAGMPTPPGVPDPCNRMGFAWGTVFPFHYWAGHREGNRRISFLSLPIQCYEVGYDVQSGANDYTLLRAHLDFGLYYRLTTNMFYHPCRVMASHAVRDAIEETLRHLRRRKANVFHSAPDALARWWMARSASRIEDRREGGARTIRLATECQQGATLRIPTPPRGRTVQVKVNGRRRRPTPGRAIADGFLMLPLERGEHEVTVTEGDT